MGIIVTKKIEFDPINVEDEIENLGFNLLNKPFQVIQTLRNMYF